MSTSSIGLSFWALRLAGHMHPVVRVVPDRVSVGDGMGDFRQKISAPCGTSVAGKLAGPGACFWHGSTVLRIAKPVAPLICRKTEAPHAVSLDHP
jgi:hypothetical protein